MAVLFRRDSVTAAVFFTRISCRIYHQHRILVHTSCDFAHDGAFVLPSGRNSKKSVLISCVLMAAGYLLLIPSRGFFALIAVSAFIGIAQTFASGAKEAWVFDLVKSKKLFRNYTAKIQILESFGHVVSGLLGAAAVKLFGIWAILPASAISYSISLSLFSIAQESRSSRDSHAVHTVKQIMKTTTNSLTYCRKHRVLFKILLASMLLVLSAMFFSTVSYTALLRQAGVADHALGYVWSALALATSLSAIAAHKMLKIGKERQLIIKSLLLAAACTALIIFMPGSSLIVLFMAASAFFTSLMKPAERVYLQGFIPAKLRATIGSVESMLLATVVILAGPLVGLLVDTAGPKFVILLAGAALVLTAATYYWIKN